MEQKHYEFYLDSVFRLAESMCFKSSAVADAMNIYLIARYGENYVDKYNPSTWKYYLNIKGQYHQFDEKIYITSLDTQQTILFDRATILNHPITFDNYFTKKRLYEELLLKHPDHFLFINGVLNPSKIQDPHLLEDGSVLAYNESLVEDWEESLINKIEYWSKMFFVRWFNVQFTNHHSLYLTSFISILYSFLVVEILNIRKSLCRTNEVHSFHVRAYLASKQNLDLFYDHLDRKQIMFLYRNINYIERYVGRRDTFDWLIENILTYRNIPIAEYKMKHNSEFINSEYYNRVKFKRNSINSVPTIRGNNVDSLTLDSFLSKEKELTEKNNIYLENNKNLIDNKFKNSLSSVVLTKDLESNILDRTDSDIYKLQFLSVNYWVYLSSKNLYLKTHIFTNPVTSTTFELNTKDAFIYFFYCFSKSKGFKIININKFIANRVINLNHTDPKNELKHLVNLSEHEIDEIINTRYNIPFVSNENEFNSLIKNLYSQSNKQLAIISNENHPIKVGYKKGLIDALHNTVVCDLTDGISYSEKSWLSSRNLPIEELKPEEYQAMYLEIFQNVTKFNFNSIKDTATIQSALIDLLVKLSSYSIQFIKEINIANIITIYWQDIRFYLKNKKRKLKQKIETEDGRIKQRVTLKRFLFNLENNLILNKLKSIKTKSFIDLGFSKNNNIANMGKKIKKVPIRLGAFYINYKFKDNTPMQNRQFLYFNLSNKTPDEIKGLLDYHRECVPENINAGKLDFNLIITKDYLNNLNYLKLKTNKFNSFTYSYINFDYGNYIKTVLEADLDIFYYFGGNEVFNAYKLFHFKNIENEFQIFNGDIVIDHFYNKFEIKHESLDLFNLLMDNKSLDLFKLLIDSKNINLNYTLDPRSINAFNYTINISSINFEYFGSKEELDLIELFNQKEELDFVVPFFNNENINQYNLLTNISNQNYIINGYTYNGISLLLN